MNDKGGSMSADVVQVGISTGILARFAELLDKHLAAQRVDRADVLRARAAGRIALEHAVLQTALEVNQPPEAVAATLEQASVEHQSMLVEQGRAAIHRLYGVSPDILVGALAGRASDVSGLVVGPLGGPLSTLVLGARLMVDQLASPGGGSARNGPVKVALVARMAFVHAAIDAGVARGKLAPAQADSLRDSFDAAVFSPGAGSGHQRRGALYSSTMAEVRTVTQSKTVQAIGAQVDAELASYAQDRVSYERMR